MRRERKGKEKKKVHWYPTAPIHCEDLEELLSTPLWMVMFVSPRSLHEPPKKHVLLPLADVYTACTNNVFSLTAVKY
jgi:hypothetical protein